MKQYSFLIGVKKGLIHAGIFGVSAAVAFLTFSHQAVLDTPLWAFAEQYVKPLIGTLSLGGVLTFGLNWLKNKDN